MLNQPQFKTFNKLLITEITGLLLYGMGIAIYLHINDPDKYLSPNSEEAMPQLYVAPSNKLKGNPSTEFFANIN